MSTGNTELDALLAFVPDDFADPEADYRQVRATMAPFHGHALSDAVSCEVIELAGLRCARIRPRLESGGASIQRRVLHCHGGAFVSCPLDDYLFYGEMIALQTQSEVILPDYRLAPEHAYPVAHDDVYAVFKALAAKPFDDELPWALMGESCGGVLALAAMFRARDEGLAQPSAFISLTAWVDMDCRGWEYVSADKFLHPEWLHRRACEYRFGGFGLGLGAGADLTEAERQLLRAPELSPVNGDFRGLPAMYFQIGEHDHFAASTAKLCARAEAAGVAVTVEHWPQMVHGWHGLLTAGLAEAGQAWSAIKAYMDSLQG